jgi:methionyl-tRNA synthetase
LRYRDVSRTDSPTYWQASKLEPNRKLRQPGPLFKKLDESVIEEERARLGK